MRAAARGAGLGPYPEREARQEQGLERLLADLGYRWHRAFPRGRGEGAALAAGVRERAARLHAAPLRDRVAEVRYRLRRDGFGAERTADCLALCWAALAPVRAADPAPEVLRAAALLTRGCMALLDDTAAREQALVLAALAMAVEGVPVHLAAADDARAAHLAQALREPLRALGMRGACIAQGMDARERQDAYGADVACAALRELALDFLRDRAQLGRERGALRDHVTRLAQDDRPAPPVLMRGLHCALVDEADALMVDSALSPIAITRESAAGEPRLRLEQALELARALVPEKHFRAGGGAAVLTPAGAARLERLAVPLEEYWVSALGRDLVAAALAALHAMQRDRDYAVEQGRLLRRRPEGEARPAGEEPDALQGLLELKEGCTLSGRRDVQSRLSVPGFFGRYLHLAGVSARSAGLTAEFWALYGRRTASAGMRAPAAACAYRVFATGAARNAALLRVTRDSLATGRVLIAMRTSAAAQPLADALAAAGLAEGVGVSVYPAHRTEPPADAHAGPLHLLVAELHDAGRHVERIRAACGAHSCCQFLALDDAALEPHLGAVAAALARALAGENGELQAPLAQWIARGAQAGAEQARARVRRDALRRERQIEEVLAFSGGSG
jgi:preprotein translocase subunit SecA